MCVYHAVPMVDWNLTGQNPQLTVTAITDFPQPAFDQLGMQAVPALNLHNNPSRTVSGSLGYNLRYWQWKSDIDTVFSVSGSSGCNSSAGVSSGSLLPSSSSSEDTVSFSTFFAGSGVGHGVPQYGQKLTLISTSRSQDGQSFSLS